VSPYVEASFIRVPFGAIKCRPDFVSGVSSSTRGLKLKFWRGNEVPPLEAGARAASSIVCFWSELLPLLHQDTAERRFWRCGSFGT